MNQKIGMDKSRKSSKLLWAAVTAVFLFVWGYTRDDALISKCLYMLNKSQAAPIVPVVDYYELQAPSKDADLYTLFELASSDAVTTVPFTNATFTGATIELSILNKGLVDSLDTPIFEILIGNVTVVRTTAPPSEVLSYTNATTVFDISSYLSLLNGKTFDVSIVTLAGESGLIEISANLLLTRTPVEKLIEVFQTDVFTKKGPADKVVALSGWTFDVPAVSPNTTAVELNLFVSAIGEEVGYFKTLNPLRYFNVYIDEVYAGTININPNLFHDEDISTDNFKPVVSNGQFSGHIYELDLVAYLPLLWKGANVRVELLTPFTTLPAISLGPISSGAVSQEWLVSGSLLLWESAKITSAKGKLQPQTNSETVNGALKEHKVYSPWQPKITNSSLNTTLSLVQVTELLFTLKNNATFAYNVTHTGESKFAVLNHFKTINNHGPYLDAATIVTAIDYKGKSKSTVSIISNFAKVLVHEGETSSKVSIKYSGTDKKGPLGITHESLHVALKSKFSSPSKVETSKENLVTQKKSIISTFEYALNEFKDKVTIIDTK